jgi:hypothetical protein
VLPELIIVVASGRRSRLDISETIPARFVKQRQNGTDLIAALVIRLSRDEYSFQHSTASI